MQLPVYDITSLIPQKHPFVMVNALLQCDENSTQSTFLISAGNVFVKNGVLEEGGLMENIAQTAALRAGYTALVAGQTVNSGYIASVTAFEILALPNIGDELTTEVYINDRIGNMTVLMGKIWLGGAQIASCEMKVIEGN
jgi:predicted hotdog family 3-hydroxylacyl-ACP dehydratase